MIINTRGNLTFAFSLRSRRIIPFLMVGMTTTMATIVFQTMTQNNILTPNIIGLDALYILLQTCLVFFFGLNHSLVTNPYLNYFVSLALMIVSSIGLYWLFFKRFPGRIYLMLITGLIMGTFFSNFTTFLQVMIDPNEFESIFAQTIASFNTVNSALVIFSLLISLPILVFLFFQSSVLDVLHLGKKHSMGLGIDGDRYYLLLFILISVLTAVSTALVGPVSFLGFIGANLSYRLFKTYKHHVLFLGGSLISILFILVGQIFVEHIFRLQTTLGVVVQFIGGIYFLFILLKERNVHA